MLVPLNETYPGYAAALKRANLKPPSEYPTIRESLEEVQSIIAAKSVNDEEPTEESIRADAKKARDKARTTWFCIGYSTIWGLPISVRLKRLRAKYNLTWLRNSMSYHKFTNLGEQFNGDLTGKVMDGVNDFDLRDRPCGCHRSSKRADGRCFYDGNCRRSMVVYKLRCKCCDSSYFGKTQLYLRDRTQQHFGDVWKVIETGRMKYGEEWRGSGGYTRADAFAKHFADHCRDCSNSNEVIAKLKELVEPSIEWQGKGI